MRFQISEKQTFGENRAAEIDPSISLSKPYSGHVFGFQVQSVNGNLNGTAKRNICTRKWSTGAQMVER